MEQQFPLVSVIVPVYNSESTLDQCLKSICGQSYRQIEVLVIDDGSEDQSAGIIGHWARRDPRVRLIAKANGGVSQARNLGIEYAKGQFLQFVDSDDRLPSGATHALVGEALISGSDLVVADYYMVTGRKYTINGSIEEPGVYSRRQYAQLMMRSPSDFYYGVLWNKLYRAAIVRQHGLRCPEDLSWCEDFFFNLEYLRYARSISVIKKAAYYYIRRKNSLSTTGANLAKALQTRLSLFAYYKELYAGLDLYEENKLGISLYPLTFAHDAGYRIRPEIAEAGEDYMGSPMERRNKRRKPHAD